MSEKIKLTKSTAESRFKQKSKRSKRGDCQPLKDDVNIGQKSGTDLSESELNEQFEIFLDDMEIPEDKKKLLREKDMNIKLTMISRSKNIIIPTPAYYVDLLKQIIHNHSSMNDATILNNLESVWISLNSYKVSWLKQFYESPNDGLNFLIDVIKAVKGRHDIELMCLKCFRAFANCGFGLFKVIEHEQVLMCISTCLRPENPVLMILAVEILTIFGFYSVKSHRNVLEALHVASKINNYTNRFEPIIKGAEVCSTVELESLSYSCVRFISVLINPNFRDIGSEPLKLYYCLHLRREFINYGLLNIFVELQKRNDIPATLKLVNKFLDEFETERDENRDEAEAFIDSFENCEAIFSELKRSVCNTAAEINLQSILGTLLIVKDDPLRNSIYEFIDKVNAEIILQNDEDFCPDPTLRTFNEISLKKMIASTVMEENRILKDKLSKQKLDYDELKLKFNAYKARNPSNTEQNFIKDIHIPNSTDAGMEDMNKIGNKQQFWAKLIKMKSLISTESDLYRKRV